MEELGENRSTVGNSIRKIPNQARARNGKMEEKH